MKKWILAACGLLLGCSGIQVEQYRNEKPSNLSGRAGTASCHNVPPLGKFV